MVTSTRYSTMVEDYLAVIWKAQEWGDQTITTSAIASTLQVAPSSVSGNLKKLARDGLIDYEPYGRIDLSPAGRSAAVAIVRRHRIIETYLVERLRFSWDEVHREADLLEHAASDRFVERLAEELGQPAVDPHGDPIPAADGTVRVPPSIRLSELLPGEEGIIIRIADDDPEILRFVTERTIGVGTRVVMVDRHLGAGSVTVRVADAAATDLPLPSAHSIRIGVGAGARPADTAD